MNLILFLVLASLFFIITMHRLEWGLLFIIGIIIFFREGWYPGLEDSWVIYDLSIANLHLFELFIIELFVVMIISNLLGWKKIEKFPRYTGFVLLFCLLIIFSALYGYYNGAILKNAFGYNEWRALFWSLILFITVPNILNTQKKVEWFITIIFYLVLVRCLFGFYGYLFGEHFYHVTLKSKVVFWDSGDNLILSIMAVLMMAIAINVKPFTKYNLLRITISSLFVLTVVLSLRRSYWLFLTIAGISSLVMFSLRKQLKIIFVVFLCGIALFAALLLGFGGKMGDKLIDRTASFFSTNADTNKFHFYDIYDAFLTIQENVFLGVGYGRGFKRVRTSYGVGADEIKPNIVHSIYMHIWLKMGLIGLGLFILIWIFYLFDAIGAIYISRISVMAKSVIISQISVAVALLCVFVFGTTLFGNSRAPFFIFTFLGMLPVLTKSAAEDKPYEMVP